MKHPSAFPIVGIGASAGGFETFSKLLKHLPNDTGMAFVLIQHLDPTHASKLAELLSPISAMPVTEAKNNTGVKPNNVYVIPPNVFIEIMYRVLKLSPRKETPEHEMSIDHFFRSLASDQKENAISVILSGNGTDGTLGMQEIKAKGGITFAEDEKTAKYTGMPHSAIASGNVDIVLPVEEIAKELVRKAQRFLQRDVKKDTTDTIIHNDSQLYKIFEILRESTGVDFTYYKHNTIRRRLQRRMMLHKIQTFDAYADYLKGNRSEIIQLYNDMLISVTSFFRDPELYQYLKEKIFPRLIKDSMNVFKSSFTQAKEPVRIWVPGCATGEEVYSLAISFLETLEKMDTDISIQIFGTDINNDAIEKARLGIYIENIKIDVSARRLEKYFTKIKNEYQVNKPIREMCVFARQNVVTDPPFSRLDIISCRNLLIYLEPVLQRRIIPVFHYALKQNGYLILGPSESVGEFSDMFVLENKKYKLYSKKFIIHKSHFVFHEAKPPEKTRPEKYPSPSEQAIAYTQSLQKEAERIILQKYAPAGVVVNAQFEIIQFRGHTSQYLEPAPGKASLNLLKMAREGLFPELNAAIHQAKKERLAVGKKNIRIEQNGKSLRVNIDIIPLFHEVNHEPAFLVMFENVSEYSEPPVSSPQTAKDFQISRLKQELSSTREYLQSTIEELETNNEELQSVNEELETSKEELQSTNEELITVNDELQNRNIEINQINNDLKKSLETNTKFAAIVGSSDDAIISQAPEGIINSWNPAAKKMFGYTAEEVIGKHITLIIPEELHKEEETILNKLQKGEHIDHYETVRRTKTGRRITVSLSISPIKNERGIVIGAVKIARNISESIRNEENLTFLSEASKILSSSLDYQTTLKNIAEIAVPEIADWSAVDMKTQDGIQQLAVAHVNPAKVKWAKELNRKNPPDPNALTGVPQVLRTGKPEFYPVITDEMLVEGARNEKELELLRKLKLSSAMVVPLIVKKETIGALTFITAESGYTYTKSDLLFAMEVANRAAIAIENARLFTQEQKAVQLRDEFISVASHELKTPITSLKMYAQVLQKQLEKRGETDLQKHFTKMDDQINKLTGLINDLLNISKLKYGKLEFVREPVDLNELVKDTVADAQLTMIKHEIKVTGRVHKKVYADRYRIYQVVTNLLTNAMKYSPQSNSILVLLIPGKNAAAVSVQDFGIGIDKEQQEKIFHQFYRVNSPEEKTYPGLGMGLYISKEIVIRHGGEISVESANGKGSKFTFTLPYVHSTI